MDWTPVLEFLMTLAPWVSYVMMGLGALVVIATAVDAIIPVEPPLPKVSGFSFHGD